MNAKSWVALVASVSVAACSQSTGPGPAARLVFEVQPVSVGAGAPFVPTVVVGVEDGSGHLALAWAEPVTLSLEGGPSGGAALQGTASENPENGLAWFDGLTVPAAGHGYTLVARSGDLRADTSAAFDVAAVFHSTQVSVGDSYTCALDSSGAAWCWGANKHGELGDGTTTSRALPTAVNTDARFVRLSVGAQHTCGLDASGMVYCWGENGSGQVGSGDTSDVLTPHSVTLPGPAVEVAAGFSHSCALVQGGMAYCWGANPDGTLGTGSSDSVVVAPEPVTGGHLFASVTASYDASCGLTPAGAAYCWGDNLVGSLGDGTLNNRSAPTPVVGGHVFVSLTSGGFYLHSITCGLAEDGENYCWGRTGDATSTPTPLPGDPGLTALAIGGEMACGTTASGALYCWSSGGASDLGNGVAEYTPSPVPVMPNQVIVSVAVGRYHTCAVTTVGETWCWGANTSGDLGNGSNSEGWLLPVPVWAPGS